MRRDHVEIDDRRGLERGSREAVEGRGEGCMLTCEGCGKVGVLGLGTRWVLGLKETEEGQGSASVAAAPRMHGETL